MPFLNGGAALAIVQSLPTAPLPKTPAEWLTPPVFLTHKGNRWPIVFTHRALLVCEHTTGENMLAANLLEPSAFMLRAMLYGALVQAGSGATLEDAGQVIGRQPKRVREAIIAAWVLSMPKPEERDEEDDEPKPDDDKDEPISWVDVWASIRFDLQLSFEEFLDLTPRMLRAIQRVRLAKMQREELMNGMLLATIENFSPNHPKQAVQPEEFMFHPFKRKPGSDRIWGEDIMREVRKFERKTHG